ncbi:MAG: STAS domain-containing protein [Rhodanobacter sp.]
MSAIAATLRLDGDVAGTLAVHGELGFATAALALEGMRSAMATGALRTLDLSGVTHGDSAGLACLLAVMADAARSGQALQLLGLPEHLGVLAQVCGAGPLLATPTAA